MGAFGVGCEAIILAPVLATIDDQQITEDGSVTLELVLLQIWVQT